MVCKCFIPEGLLQPDSYPPSLCQIPKQQGLLIALVPSCCIKLITPPRVLVPATLPKLTAALVAALTLGCSCLETTLHTLQPSPCQPPASPFQLKEILRLPSSSLSSAFTLSCAVFARYHLHRACNRAHAHLSLGETMAISLLYFSF